MPSGTFIKRIVSHDKRDDPLCISFQNILYFSPFCCSVFYTNPPFLLTFFVLFGIIFVYFLEGVSWSLMDTFIFLLGILLIILCASVLPLPLFTYFSVKRRPVFLYLFGLLSCYLVELIELMYIAHFRLTPISEEHLFNLINFPVLRIITAVLFLLFDFLILLEIMELKFYKKYLLIFVPLIVVCTFLATQTPTMMVVWLFYLPRQIYRLAFCILFFVRLFCEKQKRVQQKLQHFSYVMLGVFLLNFSIFLEDTLLIFHIESFLTDMLSMTERNFSENALWCFISISIFIYCTHQMQLATKQKQQLAKEDFPGIPNKQPVNPMDRLPEIIAYYKLTPREAEILPLILQRKSSTAIAEELFISIGTVKTHTHNLYAKFHVNSKTELIHALFDFSKK